MMMMKVLFTDLVTVLFNGGECAVPVVKASVFGPQVQWRCAHLQPCPADLQPSSRPAVGRGERCIWKLIGYICSDGLCEALVLSFGLQLISKNIWMNEAFIYRFIVYCCTPKALYNHVGVSPQPPPVCSIHLDDTTAATGQRRQCAHRTPATGGEEREIEPIKWIIKWICKSQHEIHM